MTARPSQIISAADLAARNQSPDPYCRRASLQELLAECDDLELFRRRSENLYERVRALFFLYAIHRFHVPLKMCIRDRLRPGFRGT